MTAIVKQEYFDRRNGALFSRGSNVEVLGMVLISGNMGKLNRYVRCAIVVANTKREVFILLKDFQKFFEIEPPSFIEELRAL